MKIEFMVALVVETTRNVDQKEVEKIRRWLQRSVTTGVQPHEMCLLLKGFPKIASVASPGTPEDWENLRRVGG